jgi:hypothetical protein
MAADLTLSLIELAAYPKKSTISSREMQISVCLILPGELERFSPELG